MLAKTSSSQWERAPEFSIGTRNLKSCKDLSIVRGLAYHRRVYRNLAAWCAGASSSGFTFIEEPWLRRIHQGRRQMCQPDSVLLDEFTGGAIVVEAKMNWKDGRDEKLINLYLSAAKSAFGLVATWPLLITGNVRGYRGQPLLGLAQVEKVFEWRPGMITPVMLLP